MMRISAIIPAFNAEKFLERAVNSLLGTQYPDLEIVIVNDGSTDNTWGVAQSVAERCPKVRVFSHEDGKNHGVSAARNLGMAKCSGDLVCFLDADDYVFPHRFDIAVKLLSENSEIDAIHELAAMEFEQGKGAETFWDKDEMFGIRAATMERCSFETLLAGVCWNPGCILLRKELLDKTGTFPESFRFAEDYHLWLRMVCVGNVVAGNDKQPVSVYYRHSENTYKGGLERKVDVTRAMIEVYRWLRKRPDIRISSKAYAEKVCAYVRHALIRAREESRLDIGRSIVNKILANRFFPALRDRQLLLQSAWVLVGREARSHSSAAKSHP